MEFVFVRISTFPLNYYSELLKLDSGENKPTRITEELIDLVYFSSLKFYEIIKGKDFSISLTSEKYTKIEITIYKYLVRSIFRTTPFALFGTLSNAHFSENPTYEMDNEMSQAIYLNFETCEEIINLENNKGHVSKLKYRLNNTIYKYQDGYRFISRRKHYGKYHYLVCEIKDNTLINSFIDKFKDKEFSINQILKIFKNLSISQINALIENQFIHLHNQYSVNNVEIEKLARAIAKKTLNININKFKRNDSLAFKKIIEINNKITSKLVLNGISVNGPILKINNYRKSKSISINKSIRKKVFQAAEVLFLQTNRRLNNNPLKPFIDKFLNSYQEGIYYPIVEVLDPDTGIGIEFDTVQDERIFKFTDPSSKLKVELYIESRINDTGIVYLNQSQIDYLRKDNKQFVFPNALTFTGEIYKNIENKEIISNITFVSSISSLIGRFTEDSVLSFDDFQQMIQKFIDENENVIFADINFSPNPLFSNILNRKTIFNYEICYLYESNNSNENKIYINDLFLTHRDGELVLYSKTLGKRVIPILSNSISYKMMSNPIFRFLCEIQNINTLENLYWNWEFLNNEIFLPRVVYNDIILTEARWKFHKDILKLIDNFSLEDFTKSFNSVRSKYKLPNIFYLQKGEDRILINLTFPLCFSILKSELENNKIIILFECLLVQHGSPFIDSKNNNYCGELIYSFLPKNFKYFNSLNIKNYQNPIPPFIQNEGEDIFLPFSEWLYIKVYLPEIQHDNFLINLMQFISINFNDLFIKWYFVRYVDIDGNHLRLRFHGEIDDSNKIREIVTFIKSQSPRTIKKIQIDTYKRELLRYDNKLEDFEILFYYNSNYVIQLLELIRHANVNFEIRPIISFICTVLIYHNSLPLNEIIKELTLNVNFFELEFDLINKPTLKIEMNTQYAYYREALNTKRLNNQTIEVNNLFKKALIATEKFIFNYSNSKIQFGATSNNSLTSYIHMFHNRLFDRNQRKFELFVNTFCLRYFKEIQARNISTLGTYFNEDI